MKEGDKVSFVKIIEISGGFKMSVKEGVIKEVLPRGYNIKMRNGRIIYAPSRSVRLTETDNALTELFKQAGADMGAALNQIGIFHEESK